MTTWSAIVQKALPNPEYKKALLENPREVIEKETGVSLPAGVQYVVHEQTAHQIHLILPLNQNREKLSAVYVEEGEI